MNSLLMNPLTGRIRLSSITSQDLEYSAPREPETARIIVLADMTYQSTDLSDPETLQRLIDCLLYALGLDDATVLAMHLGMPEGLDNHQALGLWIRQETQAIGFLDASALFNYVFKQLENLTNDLGRPV